MKTKEIDVWVNPNSSMYSEFDDSKLGATVMYNPDEKFSVKAKLIIEIPEKKIEITEREFLRKAIHAWNNHHGCVNGDVLEELRLQLFK